MGFILVINAGSSSLKFKLYDFLLKEISSGIVEKIGQSGSFFKALFADQEIKSEKLFRSHADGFQAIMQFLQKNSIQLADIKKVGHRVVHGADKFIKPVLLNESVITELEKFNDLAPLHNPHNLAVIDCGRRFLPLANHYAVFDTAFHQTLPEKAFRYALPNEFYQENKIRRYGFQGLSHEYVTGQAAKKLKKRVPNLIICHLGSGASVCAVKAGKSIDTSMGLTPLEGLMMMSRTGDIDPGVIFHLARHGFTLKKIEEIFNKESGLLGISGMSDMRDIMVAAGYKIAGYDAPIFTDKQRQAGRLALQMFVYRVKKYIGAYYAILGRVDAIVFTAGIGERNSDIRQLILQGLPIKAKVLVIPTDEELMIARLIYNKI